MNEPISIGLGERSISQNKEDVLVAYGLGSCLAISMVDPARQIGGLLHAVLPENTGGGGLLSSKYVDSGIEGLLNDMLQAGAERYRIAVRMVGGANMLLSDSMANTFDIGSRNVLIARRTLEKLNLKVRSEHVGGHTGRTVRLYVGEGRTTVRVIGDKEEDL
ncbi:MAG TPA: chemotaxis protein CheD [Anaerolineaceae bacterium]|nr:chemotaxis protein CheD [Anaerolineaceae bacterium]